MSKSDNFDGSVITKRKTRVTEPPLFRVILINDHYTTQEFVVLVLEQVFNKNQEEAKVIMMKVHNEGSSIVGIFTKEIAEMKVAIVHHLARQHEFPLKCIMEPDH